MPNYNKIVNLKSDKLEKDIILLRLSEYKLGMRDVSRLSVFLQLLRPYRPILRVHSVSLSSTRKQNGNVNLAAM